MDFGDESRAVKARLTKCLEDITNEDRKTRGVGWENLRGTLRCDEIRAYLNSDHEPVHAAITAYSNIFRGLLTSIRLEQAKKVGKGGKAPKKQPVFRMEVSGLVLDVAKLAMEKRPAYRLFLLNWQPLPFIAELVKILQEPLPIFTLTHLYGAITLLASFFRSAKTELIEDLVNACERAEENLAPTAFKALSVVIDYCETIPQDLVRQMADRLLNLHNGVESLTKLVRRWPLSIPPNLGAVLDHITSEGRVTSRVAQEAALELGCYWGLTPSRDIQRLLRIYSDMLKTDELAEIAWILELVEYGEPEPDAIIQRFMDKTNRPMKNRPPLCIVGETLRTCWPVAPSVQYKQALQDFLMTPLPDISSISGSSRGFPQEMCFRRQRLLNIRRMQLLDTGEEEKNRKKKNSVEPSLTALAWNPSYTLDRFLQLCIGGSSELIEKAVDICKNTLLHTSSYFLLCSSSLRKVSFHFPLI